MNERLQESRVAGFRGSKVEKFYNCIRPAVSRKSHSAAMVASGCKWFHVSKVPEFQG